MITIFGAGGLSDADVARLRRVESKLDLILQNLGIPWQEPDPAAGLSAFMNTLKLFGMGYSWGGFESLAVIPHFEGGRTATTWKAEGPLVRLHIGLEDPDDLIADLEASFAASVAG